MERLIVVGLTCAQPNRYDRPTVRQAFDILNLKALLPPLPLEMPMPTYVAKHFSTIYASRSSNRESGSSRTQFTSFTSKANSSETTKSFTSPI